MLEKSLSLPFARFVVTSIGVFVILFGMADISARVGALAFGRVSGAMIFGSFVAQGTLSQQGPSLVSSRMLASTTPIVPTRLKIPSIGVDAPVEQVGNTPAGAMATPKNFVDVGWYSPGATPGAEGSAVFAGHVNNALTKAGVFEHLSQVKIGDTIAVSDSANKTLIYVVTEIGEYPAEGAPAASIFSSSGPSQLVLITCDGSWDSGARSFDKRLVVYAHLRLY